MEKFLKYIFNYCRDQFLLHTCILVVVMFHLLHGRIFIICGIITVVFPCY